MRSPTVSCALCFHREGLLAHTTLLSIAVAREYAERRGFRVEFSITLDCCDALTELIVRGHPAVRASDVIARVEYGDPGLSRNRAVAGASGEYVVCMDGDDYYSKNYIAACVAEAAKSGDAVAHPEYIFYFGLERRWRRVSGPGNAPCSPYVLFSAHPYCSSLTARRDVFARLPFVMREPGFGHEDWHWNCRAVAAGLKHGAAEGAVLFYRQKAESLCRRYDRENALIPPCDFFARLPEPENVSPVPEKSGDPPEIPEAALPWKDIAKHLMLRLLPDTLSGRALAALRAYRRGKFLHQGHGSLLAASLRGYPAPLGEALRDVMRIDGALHPAHTPSAVQDAARFTERPGKAYAAVWRRLARRMGDAKYDLVCVTPQIGIGGADLMTVKYLEQARAFGKRALCLTTANRRSEPDFLPEQADFFELHPWPAGLGLKDQEAILVRLLLELAPAVLHVVNDPLSSRCLAAHARAMGRYSRLVVSLFADNFDDDGGISYGLGTFALRSFYPHVHKVVTDNAVTAGDWMRRFGLPGDFFQPVYRAVDDVSRKAGSPEKRDRVLWAGRMAEEKRLDVAYAVAKAVPELRFDFYGILYPNAPAGILRRLKRLPNVTLRGAYAKFSDLPAERYFAFFYTTRFDGLPNVLLEATAAGLPVVAPDRGGIRDLVTNETGWLLSDNADAYGYAAALREIQNRPEEAAARWGRARDLLLARHTPGAFAKSLSAAYGWFRE